jgi:hypothetical protein
VSDPRDDQLEAFERDRRESWTVAYKWPIRVVTGVMAFVFASSLFSGFPFGLETGATGLALVVVWVIVYNALYRRGH